MRRFEVVRLQ